ncbi:dihydroorotase [Candidatus Poribacteria bacterium]|nr:dihydroorotase [Candidatus Poribacteria bacterium]
MRILVHGGKVVDPANGLDQEILDILVADGKIVQVGNGISQKNAKVIDARGFIVTPGLIDMHVHLREPGQEHKETIATGTRAAAKGGFTSIVAMANTQPVADSSEIIHDIIQRAKKDGIINVFPIGSVTMGLKGIEITDIKGLLKAGAVALSDDGKPLENSELMKRALLECKKYGIPIIDHCEKVEESYKDWVINKGEVSSRLGVIGIPNSAEEFMVERDIRLAEITGAYLHIAHVSTSGSVELLRKAKPRGINVTAEATPHHFSLTNLAVQKYGANAKMNPPLRTQNDVDAVIAGLWDNTIDVIATDHAPHSSSEKSQGLEKSPFGIIGLETCVPLVITRLVNAGFLTLCEAIAKMTVNPARILKLNKGSLSEGADGDITIIDIKKEQTVDPSRFESKGRNTPFSGLKLKGWPVVTIVGGKIVFQGAIIN